MSFNTAYFFENGNAQQFDYMLGLYDKCLRLKAEDRSSKPENIIKLDKWYQNELPKKIKSRGKDAHLIHDEIVQTIKWKLARGKYRPNLVNLIQMNTPRVVMQETKKAFRKLAKTQDIEAASLVLCNLKGVGPAMASAVLAAGAPELAPFMADECLLSMPNVEGLDYTMKVYCRFVAHVQACVDRLTLQGGSLSPHQVELAVWSHYIAFDLSPDLLTDLPAWEVPKTNGSNINKQDTKPISGTDECEQQNGNSCSSLATTTSAENSNDATSSEEAAAVENNVSEADARADSFTVKDNGVERDGVVESTQEEVGSSSSDKVNNHATLAETGQVASTADNSMPASEVMEDNEAATPCDVDDSPSMADQSPSTTNTSGDNAPKDEEVTTSSNIAEVDDAPLSKKAKLCSEAEPTSCP